MFSCCAVLLADIIVNPISKVFYFENVLVKVDDCFKSACLNAVFLFMCPKEW